MLNKYNPFASVVEAAIEYDENNTVKPFNHGYTGDIVERTVSSLSDIETAISDANNNPNDLYVLTYNKSGAMEITSEVTLTTSGHVKLVRGSNNTDYMFILKNNAQKDYRKIIKIFR